MELSALKKQVQEEVEAHRKELIDLNLKIHDNPEVAYNEVKTAGWLTEYLEKNGFKVEKGISGLATAFRAVYGQGKPVIAMVADLDALPDIGHGCGHNIVAVAATGAGIAAKPAVDKFGGTVLVIGTPAEEVLGGKVTMVEKGAFEGIDVALRVHPTSKTNPLGRQHTAVVNLEVEFWGKASHAASYPWDGVNALQALITAFENINAFRFHMRDRTRIAGIITDGGKRPNVVPEHAAGKFMLRAVDNAALDELCDKVVKCLQAAALSTGARLDYRWGMRCDVPLHNRTLLELWTNNMKQLGREVTPIKDSPGSSDMSNVSTRVPSIFPQIAMCPNQLAAHSVEFAAASCSEGGILALLDGTKAMAMTAVDVLGQQETLLRVKEEFQKSKQH